MNIVWNLDKELMTVNEEDRAMIEQNITTFSNTPHLLDSEFLNHKIESEAIIEKHAISSKKQKVVTFSDSVAADVVEHDSDTSLSGETLDTGCDS